MKKYLFIVFVMGMMFLVTSCIDLSVIEIQTGSIDGYIVANSHSDYLTTNDLQSGELDIRILPQNDKTVELLNTYSSVSGVKVVVNGTYKVATTDSNGYFKIDDLSPGKYTVSFSHANFKAFTKEVTVYANNNTSINSANFPIVHNLLVAIDDYYGESSDLYGCINGMNYYLDNFYKENYFYGHGLSLEDEYATKQNIKACIEEIGNSMDSQDEFVFFYSGHGYSDGHGTEYICNYVNGNESLSDWISDDELENWLRWYIPNNKVTVILDSCHSGGFIYNNSQDSALTKSYQSLEIMPLELNKKGYTVITGAAYNEYAWEMYFIIDGEEVDMGLLTKFLVDGVRSSLNYPADKNRDGEITATELFNYTEAEMIDYQRESGFYEDEIAYPQFFAGDVDPALFRYR